MFPYYIIYGMTSSEYMDGDPWLAKVYRDAYIRRQELENSESWWSGVYIKQAVRSALSETMPWFKHKTLDYPKEPYRVTPLTEEEKKQQVEKERQKAIDAFNRMKDAWDKKNGKH